MSKHRIWVVWGGLFADPAFTVLEPGTEELYGPFHDREAALRVWQEESRRKIDVAAHRLFILRATEADADEPPE